MQGYGGISRYFSELMHTFHMTTSLSIKPLHSALFSNNQYSHLLPFPRSIRGIRSRSIANLLNTLYGRLLVKSRKIDCVHQTYYNSEIVHWAGDIPLVITYYDMIHELFPELGRQDQKLIRNKELLASKASRLIAISETTKKDCVRLLGVSPDKIDVVYLASSFSATMQESLTGPVPDNFLLFVGNRRGYKNFSILCDALNLLPRSERLSIVCAGGGMFTPEEQTSFLAAGVSDRIMVLPAVTDGQLATLFSKARCFVFPSYYEGFGIPLLEAFRAGCPVIASNASCFPEIAVDAAMLVDPHDPNAFASSIETLLHDRHACRLLKERGFLRAADFSWQKCAHETAAVYRKTLYTNSHCGQRH